MGVLVAERAEGGEGVGEEAEEQVEGLGQDCVEERGSVEG